MKITNSARSRMSTELLASGWFAEMRTAIVKLEGFIF